MNILIGGTGFIGSALARTLVSRQEAVIVIGRPGEQEIPGTTYFGLDLHVAPIPQDVLEQGDDVFLLIGQIGPDFDAQKELALLERIVRPLANGTQRVFLFSTVLVYGECRSPASETAECRPIGAYPQFKLQTEALVRSLIPSERLTIFRLANVYGSPQNRGIIGLAMEKLRTHDQSPLKLSGNGLLSRDYIFLDDVVGAVLAVRDAVDSTDLINIATGTSHTLIDIVTTVEAVSCQQLPYETVPEAPEEAEHLLVSSQLLQDQFAYRTFTPLSEGLEATLARYREAL